MGRERLCGRIAEARDDDERERAERRRCGHLAEHRVGTHEPGAQGERDENAEIDPGAERCRKREPRRAERLVEHDFQADVERDRGQRRDHRRRRVATRLKTGARRGDQHDGEQADVIGAEHPRSRLRVFGREAPAHENRLHDQVGKDEKGDEERRGERNGQRHRPVLRAQGGIGRAARYRAAHLRQQHGAGGDADHADRQLVDAVGVVDGGRAAGRQQRGDDRICEQRDLHAGRADHGGNERLEELPGVGVPARTHRRRGDAGAMRGERHLREFQNAGESDAGRRRVGGVRKQEGDAERRHHGQVEQHRREGCRRKSAVGIERARLQRHQRDEQQIGKGDARQRYREVELARIGAEARRQQIDQRRRERPGERQQQDLRGEQQREHATGEGARLGCALRLQHARIGRHESRVERAFAENGAKMIGQSEGDDKSVVEQAAAEHGRQNDVAKKSGQAGQQREAADRKQIADHSAARPIRVAASARSPSSIERCRATM